MFGRVRYRAGCAIARVAARSVAAVWNARSMRCLVHWLCRKGAHNSFHGRLCDSGFGVPPENHLGRIFRRGVLYLLERCILCRCEGYCARVCMYVQCPRSYCFWIWTVSLLVVLSATVERWPRRSPLSARCLWGCRIS